MTKIQGRAGSKGDRGPQGTAGRCVGSDDGQVGGPLQIVLTDPVLVADLIVNY